MGRGRSNTNSSNNINGGSNNNNNSIDISISIETSIRDSTGGSSNGKSRENNDATDSELPLEAEKSQLDQDSALDKPSTELSGVNSVFASVAPIGSAANSSNVTINTTGSSSNPPLVFVDNVYLNGLHALRSLNLHNPSLTHHVSVRIKSTLGSQLAFQLTNENLAHAPLPVATQPQSSLSAYSYSLPLPQSSQSFADSAATITATTTKTHSQDSRSDSDSTRLELDSFAFGLPPLQPLPSSALPLAMPLPLTGLGLDADASGTDADTDTQIAPNNNRNFNGNSSPSPDSPFASDDKDMEFDPILDTPTPFRQAAIQRKQQEEQQKQQQLHQQFHLQELQEEQTSTVMKIKQNHDFQFNQLFNYVNYIDRVDLEPGQTIPLVLAFLPDDQDLPNGGSSPSRSSSPENNNQSVDERSNARQIHSPNSTPSHKLHSLDLAEELHDFFEINGLIFFFTFIKPLESLVSSESSSAQSNGTISSSGIKNDSLITFPTILAGEDPNAVLNPVSLNGRDSGSPNYQVTLKFKSRVCRSVLWTDIGETGISFDGCVVGGTYFKDFSIWNKSEIDLYWVLNTIDLSNRQNNSWLTFSDYDTAEPLDFSRPIPSYSQRRIRVTFKPTEAGEFNYDLQLENSNDSAGNTVQALVTADVKSAPTEELLRIGNNGVIDFGDCYTGSLYKQRISIKNLSDAPVELFLAVEDNVDLVFQLKGSEIQKYSLDEASADDRRASSVSNSWRLVSEESGSCRPLRTGRIRELAGIESASMSDLSNPSSSLNSRASSPATLQRMSSESAAGSSIDLLDLVGSRRGDDSNSLGGPGDTDEFAIYGSSFGTAYSTDRKFGKDGNNSNGSGGNSEETSGIDEISLRGGSERIFELCFRPAKDVLAESLQHGSNSGRLIKRNFKVILTYAKQGNHEKERKIIQCKARTCSSLIDVLPKELNFGDTDVGTLKSLPITVLNLSELPAKVEVQFICELKINFILCGFLVFDEIIYLAKVLHCFRGELIIPPKQSIEIKLDIYPRKVNPDYCKQITVVNLHNRENDQVVEVKSTHIDKNRVTFHSLFYRILTPGSTNFMDFGSVVFNAPTMRSCVLENTSKKRLVLELSSSLPEEIVIYAKTDPRISEYVAGSNNIDSTVLKEKLIDTLGDKKSGKKLPPPEITNSVIETAGLDPTSDAASPNLNHAILSPQGSLEVSESNNVKKPEYLDLASFSTLHGKEAKLSPGRKITSLVTASSSEGLQQLRKQYREGHGLGKESESKDQMPNTVDTAVNIETPDAKTRPSYLQSNGLIQRTNSRPVLSTLAASSKQPEVGNAQSKMNLNSFLKSFEEFTGVVPPMFSKQVSEEKYVKAYQLLQREFVTLVKDGRLVPVRVVELDPGATIPLFAVMTANGSRKPSIQTKAKKFDAKILIRIVEFDREIHQPQFEQLLFGDVEMIPVRELMIRCSLCRSVMELGQRNINFGYLDKNEIHTKTMIVRNKSEAPLFYFIRKSGSISSGDLTIPDSRMGLIRGYGKKEIDFIFEPSLAGQYQEKLTLENLQDRENDQTLTIKAMIRQPLKFSIDTLELDFGPCLVGEFSGNIQRISITNTSSKTRTFEIRIDDEKLDFRGVVLDVRLEAVGGVGDGLQSNEESLPKPNQTLSKEIMEKIEELEQKLKIYHRKGKTEKIKKATLKLEKLRSGNAEDDIGKSKEEGDDPSEKTETEPQVSSLPKIDRSKYTAKPLVISVESRAIKTIKVHVKPIRKKNAWLILDSEVCHGAIFVHEHKNTDVMKIVSFRCVPCVDPGRFAELLAAEGLVFQSQNPINDRISFDSQSRHLTSEPLVSSPIADKPAFTLELAVIDLGRLEVNEKRDCYFTVFNQRDEKLRYDIILVNSNSMVTFKQNYGELEPRESRKIYLQIIPAVLGRQFHKFQIKILETIELVEFTFYGIRNSYLQFPALASLSTQLDFGPCYINPTKKYAKVYPFDIVNASENELSVSASSNLAQQCFIFSDQNLETPATDLFMVPRQKLTVYIALQPSVLKPSSSGITSFSGSTKIGNKSNANLNGSSSVSNSGNALSPSILEKSQIESSRTLIGGLRFVVSIVETSEDIESNSTEFYLLTQTVKFCAVIGVSNLGVEECFVDLGCSNSIGDNYYGHITVLNRSPRLPLIFSIECNCENIEFEKYSGAIPAQEDDGTTSLPNTPSSQIISFTLACRQWGYMSEKVIVRNENNPQQVYTVELRFFADIGFVHINGTASYQPARVLFNHDSVYSKTRFESKSLDDPKQAALVWENVYVSNVSADSSVEGSSYQVQKKASHTVTESYEKIFEIVNATEELMEIVARASTNNKVRWILSGGSGFVMNTNMDETQSGNLLLQKHQKANVVVSVHVPPATEEILRRFQAGKSVSTRGLLFLENPEKNLVLKSIDLIASFAVSLGCVEPATVDLGRVGHLNNWEDVPFSFQIINQADCALHYNIELPDTIEIVQVTNELNETLETLCPCEKFHTVKGILKTSIMPNTKVGLCISDIVVINLYNPRNSMIMQVQSLLTLLDLKFERLVEGELVLPALTYPSTASSSLCDNWFKVVNKSEQDLKFEIDFEPSAELSDFVRLEILSRSANSHLNGILTLEPLGSLDIRVRVFVQDGARLSSNSEKSKILTNAGGVTLGSLQISTKYQLEESNDGSQPLGPIFSPKRQHIPLRCNIIEGPTFSINEKKIKFLCFPIESADTSSTIHHQTKNIVITNNSKFFALNFRVAIDYPLEFPLGTNLIEIAPLSSENEGLVEPGSQLILSVTLLKLNIGGISDSVKLHLYDTNSICSYFQTVQISITESTAAYTNTLDSLAVARYVDSERNDSVSESMDGVNDQALSEQDLCFTEEPQTFDDDTSISDNASFSNSNLSGVEKIHSQSNRSNISDYVRRTTGYLINLRGCKRILESHQQNSEPGGLFELDLGQQDISNVIVTKRIILETTTNDKVSYRIRALSDNDKSWAFISRSEGTLDSRATSHSINFNFIPSVRGMFSTYIIIDNLDNPLDSKIIRTNMVVVGKHNIRQNQTSNQEGQASALMASSQELNNVFDVIVAGLDPLASDGISNDVITMNGLYYDMEYTARSIIIQNHESVPLEFFIKSNLKSTDPTELIFSLSRSAAKVFRSVIVQPNSYMRVFLRYRPSLGDEEEDESVKMDLAAANCIDEKVIEISVNCRLVKDYQKTIYLRANCRRPQIYLATQEFSFKGKISKKGAGEKDWDISFTEQFSPLKIENLLSDPLEFEVLNDSMYFGVDLGDSEYLTPRKTNSAGIVDVN
ncbi:hypothetical protein HK100_006657, partial [Physocladia obscura]